MISEYRLSTFVVANLLSCGMKRVFDTKTASVIYGLTIMHLYLALTCLCVATAYYDLLQKGMRLFIRRNAPNARNVRNARNAIQ